jgi:hypothetical protein
MWVAVPLGPPLSATWTVTVEPVCVPGWGERIARWIVGVVAVVVAVCVAAGADVAALLLVLLLELPPQPPAISASITLELSNALFRGSLIICFLSVVAVCCGARRR